LGAGAVLGTPASGNLANCTGVAVSALSTATGAAPSYSCRAWVNFNGTGTVAIRASGNVSSITDNGTGDYTVNFTTAMSDANYSTVKSVTLAYSVLVVRGGNNSASAAAVYVTNTLNAQVDPTEVFVAIFR
jgi:hypothetical protein